MFGSTRTDSASWGSSGMVGFPMSTWSRSCPMTLRPRRAVVSLRSSRIPPMSQVRFFPCSPRFSVWNVEFVIWIVFIGIWRYIILFVGLRRHINLCDLLDFWADILINVQFLLNRTCLFCNISVVEWVIAFFRNM